MSRTNRGWPRDFGNFLQIPRTGGYWGGGGGWVCLLGDGGGLVRGERWSGLGGGHPLPGLDIDLLSLPPRISHWPPTPTYWYCGQCGAVRILLECIPVFTKIGKIQGWCPIWESWIRHWSASSTVSSQCKSRNKTWRGGGGGSGAVSQKKHYVPEII